MKRYLLFNGSNYYPSGGWRDFAGCFDDLEYAIEVAKHMYCDWWHIVDTEDDRIVAEYP